MSRRLLVAGACGSAALLAGCGFLVVHTTRKVYSELTKDERLVDEALMNYRQIVLSGQTGHIGEAFDATAEISHDDQAPVVGRPAIQAFFQSFVSYKVLEYDLKARSTVVTDDTARQTGSYRQLVSAAGAEPREVRGTFEADWSRQANGAWLIHRLHTAGS